MAHEGMFRNHLRFPPGKIGGDTPDEGRTSRPCPSTDLVLEQVRCALEESLDTVREESPHGYHVLGVQRFRSSVEQMS